MDLTPHGYQCVDIIDGLCEVGLNCSEDACSYAYNKPIWFNVQTEGLSACAVCGVQEGEDHILQRHRGRVHEPEENQDGS
jgi:hypothetical protein